MPALGALIGHWDLALAWLAYGVVHSVLAADRTKRLAAAGLALTGPRYRLLFNLLALVLLLPIAWLLFDNPGPLLWDAGPLLRVVFDLLATGVVVVLLVAGPGYDLREFFGLSTNAPSRPTLRISAWHRYVRHPWYSVALLLIWTREMYAGWLISAICVSAYFVIGARFEENKLERCFGEAYQRYRSRVPALIPFRGRALTAAEASDIERSAGR